MHCPDVAFTFPVLVPVGVLLHDVELDVGGGGLRTAFQGISLGVLRLVAVALWSGCRAMRRSRCL